MKKVLVVTYNFPPVGGAGTQRIAKYVKFLSRFGWEPVVVTPANPSAPLRDEELLKDIPQGTRVIYTKTLEPSYESKSRLKQASGGGGLKGRLKGLAARMVKALLLPDPQVLWFPGTIGVLLKTLRKEKFDVIFSSGPPFSSLLLAVVAGRLTKTPVVVDFRDEWAFSRQNWENMTRNGLSVWLDEVFERLVVSWCADFTAATETYVREIRARHAKVAGGKGHAITNGFDPEDFSCPLREPKSGDRITVLYAGTVWSATSLRNFIGAFKRLKEEKPALAERFNIKIAGRVVDAESDYLADPSLSANVELLGYLSHPQVAELMCTSHLLLLTLTDVPGAQRILPGKIFEYMASKTPVLALVPEGESSMLLRENHDGATIIAPKDEASIRRFLEEFASKPNEFAGIDPSGVERFTREALAGRFAGVLDKAAKK